MSPDRGDPAMRDSSKTNEADARVEPREIPQADDGRAGKPKSPSSAENPSRPALGDEGPTILSGGSSRPRTASGLEGRPVPALPVPGTRLGGFVIEEAIGAGGMGAVFRARDTRLDRLVALKILPPEQSRDPEVVLRFHQEGRAAARLDHENIARVYTIDHDDSYHFIAFEYIEGTTLRRRVERDGELSVAEAINFTLQIAGALVHAAERGVVHRDIKPSNIIVTPEGRAKLVDMGLARRFERSEGTDDGLTQSGMTLGTFDYISPEQARDPRDVDVRSDLYSLGCTLFHMLTGRPPFPEGTVLQKLLQHQEEPPPDVRSLNPAVPEGLAAVILKLMAKDRDRRYQTPEQLARDLIGLAGVYGIRSLGPDGIAWIRSDPRPVWERHLFWIAPLAVLLLVIGLIWWAQDPSGGESIASVESSNGISSPAAVPRANSSIANSPSVLVPPRSENRRAGFPETKSKRDGEGSKNSVRPRLVEVRKSDDLWAKLASAPRDAIVVLTEEGDYELSAGMRPPLENLEVKLQAGPNVSPRLRFSKPAEADSPADRRGRALLSFRGGRIVLEGLEWIVDPVEDEERTAIFAENVELTINRCVFRSLDPSRGRPSALDLKGESISRSLTRAAGCFFGPGLVGINAKGSVELAFNDCLFGGNSPVLSLESLEKPNDDSAPRSAIRLDHVSILATDGPVFRFQGEAPIVRLSRSVVAAEGESRAILVVADEPARLDWLGRGNLFSKIGTYLQPSRDMPIAPVWDFGLWSDDPSGSSPAREIDSRAGDGQVWNESSPFNLLSLRDPSRAFRLAPLDWPNRSPGARRGPFGPLGIPVDTRSVATEKPPLDRRRPTERPKRSNPSVAPDEIAEEKTRPGATRPSIAEEDSPQPADPSELENAPMPRKPDSGDETTVASTKPEDSTTTETPAGGDPGPSRLPSRIGSDSRPTSNESTNPPATAARDDPTTEKKDQAGDSTLPKPVRTADQFQAAIARLGPRGGIVRLASDADFKLPSVELRGSGRWTIEAEENRERRPRLTFKPEEDHADSRSAFFRLRAGSLRLKGVEIDCSSKKADRGSRDCAFLIQGGTELELSRCILTIAVDGEGSKSSFVGVRVSDGIDEPNDPAVLTAKPSAASVRIVDALIRGEGDIIDVSEGKPLAFYLENSVVASSGSLVVGRGSPRGKSPESLSLDIRRSTLRIAGGLVRLDTALDEPELPIAEVTARDSILSTTPDGDPLFRVNGQDDVASLRDRIRWEGHGVAYHRISAYRRDQSSRLGTPPQTYDRPDWQAAVAPREDSAIHGDLKFANPWNADRPVRDLSPSDFELAEGSPAATAGADLSLIPAPAVREPLK